MKSTAKEINNSMTLKELQTIVTKAIQEPSELPKDFSNIDFSNNNILQLRHLGLGGKERFIFEKINLTEANFSGTNLSAVLFKDVNLEKADFTNANLHDVIFNNCNIAQAKFHGATIEPYLFIDTTGYQEASFDNQQKTVDAISNEISSYKNYVQNSQNKSFIANIYGDQDPVINDYLEAIEPKFAGTVSKSQEAATSITAPGYSTAVAKNSSKQR